MGSVSNDGTKDSSTTLRMTIIIANVNACVDINVIEGTFKIRIPTFETELFFLRNKAAAPLAPASGRSIYADVSMCVSALGGKFRTDI